MVTAIVIAIILLFMILGTLPFWLSDLDIAVTSLFFDIHNLTSNWRLNWPIGHQPWALFFFDFGYYFSYAILLVRILLWLLPKRYWNWFASDYQRLFNILFLTLLIGNGVIINGLSKPLTDRARPAQITEFNGECAYTRPLEMGACDYGKSFPCGHCSVGFVFAAIGIALLLYRPWLGLGIFLGSIVFGSIMSFARISAGGHFLSDAIWSAIVMWITAFISRSIVDRLKWY